MGNVLVVEYGSFEKAFAQYLWTKNSEEQAILWNMLVCAMYDPKEKASAYITFKGLMELADRYSKEYIVGEVSSYELPEMLKAIEYLQHLLEIEYV